MMSDGIKKSMLSDSFFDLLQKNITHLSGKIHHSYPAASLFLTQQMLKMQQFTFNTKENYPKGKSKEVWDYQGTKG